MSEIRGSETWGTPLEPSSTAREIVNDLTDKPRNCEKAAKRGILVVPVDVIPDDMDIETFAKEWFKHTPVTQIPAIQFIPLDAEEDDRR